MSISILEVGDRIYCKSHRDLKTTALHLSSEGYGLAVLGFQDIDDNVLTITSIPEGSESDD
jgi:hypothetical protein